MRPRTAPAYRLVRSVCPYCAVGCRQNAYVRDGRVVQIEGDPDSTVSRGRLCPKGSASIQLTTGPGRRYEVLVPAVARYRLECIDLEFEVRGPAAARAPVHNGRYRVTAWTALRCRAGRWPGC